MIEKIEAFKTSDGQMFSSEIEAETYEFSLSITNKVDEFLQSKYSPYNSGMPNSICRKGIVRWEAWKAQDKK